MLKNMAKKLCSDIGRMCYSKGENVHKYKWDCTPVQLRLYSIQVRMYSGDENVSNTIVFVQDYGQ